VFIIDIHTSVTINALHFFHHVHLHGLASLDAQDILRVTLPGSDGGAGLNLLSLADSDIARCRDGIRTFFAFLKAIREPFLIAFTTASSEAALPKSLEVMERFGVPKNIVGFVLPTGYSFNLDGSTLYLSLASVFVAQLAGVQMSIGQQLVMMLTLMLTSKGVAGVPRAALVVLAATLSQFGLPLEGAAILLGIDQIMDMGRTAVNVMGNCIATAVVARWEGVLDDGQMRAFGSDRSQAA